VLTDEITPKSPGSLKKDSFDSCPFFVVGANVLMSETAIQVNIAVTRAFVP